MKSFQVDCFLAVAKTGSISKTSRDFFISQPSLSKNISMLEKELNIRLFDRKYDGVALTEEGKIMYQYFTESKEKYQTALSQARNKKLRGRKLTLTVPVDIDFSILWNHLSSLGSQIDLCDITFHRNFINDVYDLLIKGELDMALCVDDAFDPIKTHHPSLRTAPLPEIGLSIYFSELHPAAQAKEPALNLFSADTFYIAEDLAYHVPGGARTYFLRVLGYLPKYEIVESITTASAYISNNKGVSLSMPLNILNHINNICSMPLPHETGYTLVYVWNETNNLPALQRLVQALNQLE